MGFQGEKYAMREACARLIPYHPCCFCLLWKFLVVLSKKLTQLKVRAIHHRAFFYTDDIILIVCPRSPDLQLLRKIFDIFHGASGLECNMSKCQLAPIRCSSEQVQMVTDFFPCQVVNFLIKYLGIPLSTTKLPKSAFQPLVDKVVDKLRIWKGNLMNRSGRLELIRTTLFDVPIYTSISVGLPAWTIKAIVKLMKASLWTGSDTVKAGKCLVAWSTVQRPRHLGGLGVPDLKLLGMALRMRWWWLQRMDPDRSSSALPIRGNRETTIFFNSSISVSLGNGKSLLFW
jgi:hypothetical protein